MNSPRNIFITGFGLYMALSIPDYFTTYMTANKNGPINTRSIEFNSAFIPPPLTLNALLQLLSDPQHTLTTLSNIYSAPWGAHACAVPENSLMRTCNQAHIVREAMPSIGHIPSHES